MADDKTKTNAEVVTNEEGRTEPIKGKRVRLSNATTPDGAPVFGEIIIDPDTGDLLEYDLSEEAKQQLREATNKAIKAMTGDSIPKMTEAIKKALNLPNSDQLKQVIKELTDHAFTAEMRDTLRSIVDDLRPIQAALDELDDLRPYIDAELSKPEYEGVTLEELLNEYTPAQLLELPTDSILFVVLEAARAARSDAEELSPDQLPRIRYKKGTELKTSTDKLGNLFYSFAAPKGKHSGQREMLPIPREEMIPLKYEGNGKNAAPITLFYDFYYNDKQLQKLGIDNGFDSYDFFITAVFDNLYLEGNDTVSLSKVWRELGNTDSPNTKQLTELYKRAVRGAATTINIDDSEVQAAWGNDPGETYNEIISPVMPLQIKGEKFIANGNVAKAEIRILSLSPFFALSQSIGHFTTWKKEILQLYTGRKTSRYYTVLQYLMSQIAWMRNPHSKRSNKITYKELYEYNADKSTRAKQLTRDMAYRLLEEVFKPAGYVLSFKEDSRGEPGIAIRYSKNDAAALPTDKKR